MFFPIKLYLHLNTAFPFLGRLRRQAIPPEGGKSLGEWPPEAGGNLQCRGTPGRTAQRLDGLPNATQELERKGHTQTPKSVRGDL